MAGSTALKSASGNLLSRFSSFAFSSSRLSEVCGPVLAGSSIRTLSTPRKQTKQWKQNYKLRLNRKRVFFSLLGKWFEPKSNIPWLKIMIIWVIGVMRRSIVGDWRFKWLTLDSEDGFRTGCRNVRPQQQSFSGIQSTRWSFSIKALSYCLSKKVN